MLAAVEIVCVSSRTGGSLFPESLDCPGCENGLCAPVAQHRGLMKYLQADTWREPRRGEPGSRRAHEPRLPLHSSWFSSRDPG